jgi:hypothetical protein
LSFLLLVLPQELPLTLEACFPSPIYSIPWCPRWLWAGVGV